MNGPRTAGETGATAGWRAIVSDIHANHPALQAVLADMAAFRPAGVYNLGDTVGYGPHPQACIEWARQHAAVSLLGNHDAGCVGLLEAAWFNPWARAALEWTAGRLRTDLRLWLQGRPRVHRMQAGRLRVLLAHGTPRQPVTEYISPAVAAEILREGDPGFDVCFVGHTHLMGIYTRRGHRPFYESGEAEVETPCIVNVGSVGQPRDGVPEAGYVLIDPEARRLTFRRIPYPVELTQQAILEGGLPRILADRLALGR